MVTGDECRGNDGVIDDEAKGEAGVMSVAVGMF